MSKHYYESRIASNRERIRQLNDTIEQTKQTIRKLESLYESVLCSERGASEVISTRSSNYGKMTATSSRRVASLTVQLGTNLDEVFVGCESTFGTIKWKITDKIDECREEIRICQGDISSCESDINYCREQIRAIERREEEERRKRERERQEQWLI